MILVIRVTTKIMIAVKITEIIITDIIDLAIRAVLLRIKFRVLNY